MNKHIERKKFELQVAICKRAEKELRIGCPRISLLMDLDSLPDLDLRALLAAPLADFAHDIGGIVRHMDRSSFPGAEFKKHRNDRLEPGISGDRWIRSFRCIPAG